MAVRHFGTTGITRPARSTSVTADGGKSGRGGRADDRSLALSDPTTFTPMASARAVSRTDVITRDRRDECDICRTLTRTASLGITSAFVLISRDTLGRRCHTARVIRLTHGDLTRIAKLARDSHRRRHRTSALTTNVRLARLDLVATSAP